MRLLPSGTSAGEDLSRAVRLQWSLIRLYIQFPETRVSTSIISFFVHAFIVQLRFECSLASTTRIAGTFSLVLKSCILLSFYYSNRSKFYFTRVISLSVDTRGVFQADGYGYRG